jgi:stearoyl-CoA desaturase (delta-9 desaturase)
MGCIPGQAKTLALHVFAIVGAAYLSPASQLSWKTAVLCFISWQLASFG